MAAFCGAEHHELEVSLTSDEETLSKLTWHLDEPLADLSSLGFLALSRARLRARDGRAVRSGRGRAVRRLSQAPRRVARASIGIACRGVRARPRLPPSAPGAGPLGAAGTTPFSRPIPPLACSRRAPSCSSDLRDDLFSGALAEHADAASRIVSRAPRRGARRRSARGRSIPRRATRARRRHAHVLRSRVDGLLARGARAVPRPRVRGAVRAGPRPTSRCAASRASTCCARPPAAWSPTSSWPSASAGFFNEAVGDLARGARWGDSRSGSARPTRPHTQRVLDRGAVERAARTWRAGDTRQAPLLLSLIMLELWLGDYLPRAFAGVHGPARSAA